MLLALPLDPIWLKRFKRWSAYVPFDSDRDANVALDTLATSMDKRDVTARILTFAQCDAFHEALASLERHRAAAVAALGALALAAVSAAVAATWRS